MAKNGLETICSSYFLFFNGFALKTHCFDTCYPPFFTSCKAILKYFLGKLLVYARFFFCTFPHILKAQCNVKEDEMQDPLLLLLRTMHLPKRVNGIMN